MITTILLSAGAGAVAMKYHKEIKSFFHGLYINWKDKESEIKKEKNE
jgi:hypothetical protein